MASSWSQSCLLPESVFSYWTLLSRRASTEEGYFALKRSSTEPPFFHIFHLCNTGSLGHRTAKQSKTKQKQKLKKHRQVGSRTECALSGTISFSFFLFYFISSSVFFRVERQPVSSRNWSAPRSSRLRDAACSWRAKKRRNCVESRRSVRLGRTRSHTLSPTHASSVHFSWTRTPPKPRAVNRPQAALQAALSLFERCRSRCLSIPACMLA